MVSASKVLWSARPSTSKEWLGSEDPIRSLFQSEKSREDSWDRRRQEVVGVYRDQPQRRWTATVRHRHPAYGTEWQRSRRRSTTQQLAGGQSRLRREENYEVVRTTPRAFIRLQSSQIVTVMFIEQANNLFIVVYCLTIWLSFILQKNIEKILDSLSVYRHGVQLHLIRQ